ncbi:MAG: M50 family metallopeptidase [Saprospiraceae bacterium]
MNATLLKTLKFIFLIIISGAAGYFAMIGVIAILPEQIEYLMNGGGVGAIAVFLLIIISYFMVTALHELGHLLAGLAQGFYFYLYVVGFLGIKRDENERVKVYFNTDMQLFGGIAGSFPTTDDPKNLRKMAWTVAAGPLTSLITAILFGLVAFSLVNQLTPDASGWYKLVTGFLLISALLSFAIFAATTIPSRTGPFFTDRARFFRLIHGGKAAQIERAIMQLIAFAYSGKRYRDLNIETIQLIETDDSPVMHTISDYYAYYYYLDRKEYAQAFHYGQKMEQTAANLPALSKNDYLREATFCYAFIKKDAAKALQVWQLVEKFYDKQESVPALRTKVALHLVQNQFEPARQLLDKAVSKLGNAVTKGTDILEKELLEQLTIQLQEKQKETAQAELDTN